MDAGAASAPGAGTRAFYDAAYSATAADADAGFARWREHGGRLKAAHVAALCDRAGLAPRTTLEIGCGDGSLLAALAARGLGGTLDGVELSAEAAAQARARGIPAARRIEVFDGVHVPAGDGAYDLAILSHVVEHVPEPAPLLREAARVARHVLVEVPLEANRSAARPAVRAEAARIGHVHAFARDDVHALLAGAGLRILGELTDPLPLAHHAFFAATPAAWARAAAKTAVRRAVFRASPRRAERLFTVHHACLAESAAASGR